MSKPTEEQLDKLTNSVNADDDLFMKMDEAVRNHAESLGLSPDDFDWDVCFGIHEGKVQGMEKDVFVEFCINILK